MLDSLGFYVVLSLLVALLIIIGFGVAFGRRCAGCTSSFPWVEDSATDGASVAGYSAEAFTPHMMYHPQTGAGVQVTSYEMHKVYAAQGFTDTYAPELKGCQQWKTDVQGWATVKGNSCYLVCQNAYNLWKQNYADDSTKQLADEPDGHSVDKGRCKLFAPDKETVLMESDIYHESSFCDGDWVNCSGSTSDCKTFCGGAGCNC